MTTTIRTLAPLAALTCATALSVTPAPSASAASSANGGSAAMPAATVEAPDGQRAACPRGKGVTVVVQFGASRTTSCAPGDPANGLAALREAGFTVTMVQRFPGAVCRINGRPAASRDACVVMPPATAYWSYWHAKRGGKWTYSSQGAGSYNPAPSTVEGWSYGAGKPPTTPPPA